MAKDWSLKVLQTPQSIFSLQSHLTANVSTDKPGWCLGTYTQYQKAVLCKHQSYGPTYESFEVCDGLMLSSVAPWPDFPHGKDKAMATGVHELG